MNKLQKEMFSFLLSWTRAKNASGKGYILNALSTQLAIFFICNLTREELKVSGSVKFTYETLAQLGERYGDFAYCDPIPANRVHEALMRLTDIGFIKEERPDANGDERDIYNYRGKKVWRLEVLLSDFLPYDPEDK